MSTSHIQPVDLAKAYRIINHGPTVLVSARHEGVDDVMAAAWCCALDFDPPKLTVVIDKGNRTRSLIETSGRFVVQVPTVAQASLTREVGTRSLNNEPEKLANSGVTLFDIPNEVGPFVAGCSGWLSCRLVNEPHIQEQYDLFVGEVTAAWADNRVFRDGRWQFETTGPEWRSIHHISGGHFYAIGEQINSPE